ncbi:hypothetical protein R1sor_027457 [Riccia sorocarpa]|uniref:Uncharacterized protein n=1 Tax=Riccia sorocarpa TaxID=122646 RepID=A0ABD3GK04_9MARC
MGESDFNDGDFCGRKGANCKPNTSANLWLPNCLFAWIPDMDDEDFVPSLKPKHVEIFKIPKWAKEDIPNIFRRLGQVLHIPQESKELLRRDATAVILLDEEDQLLDSIVVSTLGKHVTCLVREVRAMEPKEDGTEGKEEFQQLIEIYKPQLQLVGSSGGEQRKNREDYKCCTMYKWRKLDNHELEKTKLGSVRNGKTVREDSVQTPSWLKGSISPETSSFEVGNVVQQGGETGESMPRRKTMEGIRTVKPRTTNRRDKQNSAEGPSNYPGGVRVPHRHYNYSIRAFLNTEKPWILALQETHVDVKKIKFYVATLNNDYDIIASSSVERKRGVAIIYHKSFMLLESGADENGCWSDEEEVEFRALWDAWGTKDARDWLLKLPEKEAKLQALTALELNNLSEEKGE